MTLSDDVGHSCLFLKNYAIYSFTPCYMPSVVEAYRVDPLERYPFKFESIPACARQTDGHAAYVAL